MIPRADSNKMIELVELYADASAFMEQPVINWDHFKKPLQEKSVFELGLPDDIEVNIGSFLCLSDFYGYHSASKHLHALRNDSEESYIVKNKDYLASEATRRFFIPKNVWVEDIGKAAYKIVAFAFALNSDFRQVQVSEFNFLIGSNISIKNEWLLQSSVAKEIAGIAAQLPQISSELNRLGGRGIVRLPPASAHRVVGMYQSLRHPLCRESDKLEDLINKWNASSKKYASGLEQFNMWRKNISVRLAQKQLLEEKQGERDNARSAPTASKKITR